MLPHDMKINLLSLSATVALGVTSALLSFSPASAQSNCRLVPRSHTETYFNGEQWVTTTMPHSEMVCYGDTTPTSVPSSSSNAKPEIDALLDDLGNDVREVLRENAPHLVDESGNVNFDFDELEN